MLLVSDTEAQASLFLGNIKNALQGNDALIELFGLKKNDKGVVQFLKDSETDIVVELEDGYKFRIIAKGAEQKLRGLLWNNSRPDIIIGDDMENDELVMNKERREKFEKWFKNALLPCRSDRGIVRIVGTVLHLDSMLEKLMPKSYDKATVEKPLKTFSTRRQMWTSMKYRAHTDDYKLLLWPQKKSAEEFRMLREEAFRSGTQDGYSQEYLNIPVDPSSAFFRKADFLPLREDDFKAAVRYYITVDLAISDKETADYSVFVVCAVDENKRIQVRNVIRERMDGKEIVETLLMLQKLYEPEAMGIEEMQVSKAIGPFLREEMIKNNNYISLYPMKHGGKDKITRSRSIQARMRAHGCKFDKAADWYPSFEDELMRFPRDKHDDQVDAFSYMGMLLDVVIEAPTKEALEEEAYQEEYESSGLADEGRSSTTGY
jgi:predicted phage terminase large subunit-like protein